HAHRTLTAHCHSPGWAAETPKTAALQRAAAVGRLARGMQRLLGDPLSGAHSEEQQHMSLDVKLLRESFDVVVERSPNLTHRFYEILFERYPQTRHMFPEGRRSRQEGMLTEALVAVL